MSLSIIFDKYYFVLFFNFYRFSLNLFIIQKHLHIFFIITFFTLINLHI